MRKPIKIAHVIYGLSYGGAEKLLIPFTSAIDRAHFVPYVVTLGFGGPIEQQLNKLGIPVTLLKRKGRYDLALYFRLLRFIRENQIDIVHTHLFNGDFWGGLAARGAGVKHVSTLHGLDLLGNRQYNFKQWLRVRFPHKIIAVSDAVRRTCVDELGVAEEKITVIPNGIDLPAVSRCSRNAAAVREELRLPPDRHVVISVGSLTPLKGYQYLIEAAGLLKHRKDISFFIIGEGRLRKSLQVKIDELGLSARVTLLGAKEHVREYLQIADVCVSSSLYEGHPLNVLEAMTLRKPVVASRVGGIPEIIEDGKEGFLVPGRDAARFAKAIELLCNDQALRRKMGEQSFAKVQKKFLQEQMIQSLEAFYRQCRSANVLLCDVYSPGNAGSQALIENSLKIIGEVVDRQDIAALAYDPQGVSSTLGLNALLEFFPLPFGQNTVRQAWWFLRNAAWAVVAAIMVPLGGKRLLKLFSTSKYRAIEKVSAAEVIISIGAERINDNFVKAMPWYLFQYWLIGKLGKKIIFFPQTIGPFYFAATKYFSRKILSSVASVIMVRDKFSERELARIGITQNVRFVPDVAVLQEAFPKKDARRLIFEKYGFACDSLVVGISVLRWAYVMAQGGDFSAYKQAFAEFIDWIIVTYGVSVLCCSTNTPHFKGVQNDVLVGKEIGAMVVNKEKFFVLDEFHPPEQLKSIISLCTVFVATRMHAMIFATTANVPTFSINYQQKCRAYLEVLGLQEYSIDISHISKQSLCEGFERLWNDQEKIRACLSERIPQLREKLSVIKDVLTKALHDNQRP